MAVAEARSRRERFADYIARHKRALLLIIALLIISPLFGVIGAEIVGYHEPLDVAAEMLHLHEWHLPNWTPFADYTVPGLPDTIGYIIAGAIGVGVIFAVGYLLARLAERSGSSA